jgi:two-component system sensor histidine kinase ChvG
MIYFSLRKKLLLVSLLILLVPWVGIRYIQAIENYLQQSLLDNLSHYTQSVASGLTQQAALIPEFPAGQAVFALPLQKEPQLDGYDDDWSDYTAYRQKLEMLVNQQQQLANRPTLLTGIFNDSLYLHLKVPDQDIIYNEQTHDNSFDFIELILNSDTGSRTLTIQTAAPGSISAIDSTTTVWESRIKGIWLEQDGGDGYQLELKVPFSYAAKGFNIVVNNVSEIEKNQFRLSNEDTLPLLSSPQALKNKVHDFGIIPGRRIWLLDNDGRVLVKSGTLTTETILSPVNPLFAWLLTPQLISDPWRGKTRFERDDIQQALAGESDSRRLADTQGENVILSSAWPIKVDNQTIAVLLIEESTAAIQIMQRSALSELLNLSLFVFLLLSFALIGFAGRLAARIKTLRDITDQSIDKHGRVRGEIPKQKKGDELDDLSTHVSEMLHRLRSYHDYLEKLASRLSHELRTPVAVVRSSLENIHLADVSTENIETLKRADNGIMRLQKIINRMGEASRLEQSIDDTHLETFLSENFFENMIKGYRGVYPENTFILKNQNASITVSKDLIAQCLDKLISNAVSFALPTTVIEVELKSSKRQFQLSVFNEGAPLPKGMEEQLFQSMVSIRDRNSENEEPHLGLGLHIVRLIAEFHGGEVFAANEAKGVRITLIIPMSIN